MIRRQPRKRLPSGVAVKKRILVEGLELIRFLRRCPRTQGAVEEKLGIPRREFYRYLHALRLAHAPLRRERRRDQTVRWLIARGWP
jgi:hypothetical protein